MLRLRLYYFLKPLIPWSVRIRVRRFYARRKLKKVSDVWPINEAVGEKPDGWPGWPGDKEFCFCLSHDVEGQIGLDRVKQLAELEMELGFRSSFNFIPEGEYQVPKELRDWLVENGFEVGVHDLHHDGKLFSSRKGFAAKAQRINHYLKEWGAVGYRSGFMLRNLNWLHDLNIQYDASTFDTDPFEPQPDGLGTIFPKWIPYPIENSTSADQVRQSRPCDAAEETNLQSSIRNSQLEISTRHSTSRSGYVELPYTLPQDSTLFSLLQKTNTEIWDEKLSWIAKKGGMALLNVHPDYIDFGDNGTSAAGFPAAHYRRFLEMILDKYADGYWQPLAGNLAAWFRDKCPVGTHKDTGREKATIRQRHASPKLSGKRAAVLLYSYFPSDPRPKRSALAMAAAGMEVDFFCLREDDDEPERETSQGIEVHRLPLKKKRDTKLTYVRQYASFLMQCFFLMTKQSFGKGYDVVHVHNMPDILVFSALVPKCRGAKIILDLHDPMPELMRCIYEFPEDHRMVRMLTMLERWSIRFADLVLTPNESFRRLFIERGCPPGKIDIVMNSPQASIFDPALYEEAVPAGADSKVFKLMHHGFLVARHGVDIAVRAAGLLRESIPGLQFHIYGGHTTYVDELKELIEELGLPANMVTFHGRQPQRVIAQAILDCDLGLIPNRRSPFTEINMPTRIFEYVAMGRPVIVPDTQGIRDYFDKDSALFFEPGSPERLAAVILETYRHPERTIPICERAHRVYEDHRWDTERGNFLNQVSDLLKP